MKYYITINQYAAVANKLELDMLDLAIFDFIKDFSNSANCRHYQLEGEDYIWISHDMIMSALPLLGIKTKQGIINRIDKLVKAEIIEKCPDNSIYNKSLYKFGKNYDLLVNVGLNGLERYPSTKIDTPKPNLRPPLNENLDNNIIYNNNKKNNILINKNIIKKESQEEIFEETKIDKTSKRLYRNSDVFKLAESTPEEFIRKFNGAEYKQIDLLYYHQVVADWSDQKDMKRTNNGWLATIRNFIRSDKERGRLHLLTQQSMNVGAAMDYLNNDL